MLKDLSISKDNSLLLIIDVQERLCPAMDQKWLDKTVSQIGLLALYAKKERLPVIMTEQYPKGLGKTIDPVEKHLDGIDYDFFDKTSFGCAGDEKFLNHLKTKHANKKIILTGMETHVCVYLTALGLRESGFEVWVAQDAVLSRGKDYHENGLALIEKTGSLITNSESLVFQLMGSSGGDTFKAISTYLKQH